MSIHETCQIDNSAKLGKNIKIGAYTIIGPNVEIKDNTEIGPHVLIEQDTIIGKNSKIFKGAAIGVFPQDLKFKGKSKPLIIGDRAILREYSTIGRGSHSSTVIGNDFALMSYGHVSYDCKIGNGVVLSNSVTLMGNVEIDDYVIVGALTFVNRNCRIGKLSFIGGGYRVSENVPPFILAGDEPLTISGVNKIALKKRKFTDNNIKTITDTYKFICESKKRLKELIDDLRSSSQKDETSEIIDFIERCSYNIIK